MMCNVTVSSYKIIISYSIILIKLFCHSFIITLFSSQTKEWLSQQCSWLSVEWWPTVLASSQTSSLKLITICEMYMQHRRRSRHTVQD